MTSPLPAEQMTRPTSHAATGARLLLKDPWNLPDVFDLLVLNPGSGIWTRQPCEKRWQKGALVGARFTGASGQA
ncbi:MAG: hypothetical protein V7741_05720 [Hyphomonas sp.]